MEAIDGAVSHVQNTVNVTGGGNTQARTTYIALFRLNGQPVEFSSGSPVALADGDRVVVAGKKTGNGSFRAYACKNLTTGAVSNTGLWGQVILVMLLPIVGAIFTLVASAFIGRFALVVVLGFVAGTIYGIYRLVMIVMALNMVREHQT